MKRLYVVFVALFFSYTVSAQHNTAHTRISVITCGPGDDLYSLFGHTAIRIVDSAAHTDVVYNWGGFTFDQPYFMLKFLRGNLLYYSNADLFPDFMNEYVYEHRSVYEQVLNVDSISKQKIIAAINFNMQGNNRFYKYDFLLDNCTTRIKNIVFENVNSTIKDKVVPEETSARDLIHYLLETGGQVWIKLGMDILLGSRSDRTLSTDEAMFMPAFFMKGLSYANTPAEPLAKPATVILQSDYTPDTGRGNVPLILFSIVAVTIFMLSKLQAVWAKTIISFVDSLLLYSTGLIGILILFMWFATDHTLCESNFNVAWALPFNLVAGFSLIKKPAWLSNYFFIAAVITAILLAAWFWLPQQMNFALLPIVILLLNRYTVLSRKYRRGV